MIRDRRRLQRVAGGVAVVSMVAAFGAASYEALAERITARPPPLVEPTLPEPEGDRQAVWYYGKTVPEVLGLLGTDNRLVSIGVAHASPLRLDVAIVANTGPRKMSWWWLPGPGAEAGPAFIGSFAAKHDAHLVSLAPYVVDGQTFFAAIYIGSGSGGDDKGWWWYFDMPRDSIDGLLTEHGARLIDLRSYTKGSTVYSLVMVPKGGPAETWWYTGLDAAGTRSKLGTNRARLVSLQPADPVASTFDVVMSANPVGTMPAYDNVSWAWDTASSD